jgi:hypothetical protein
MPKWQMPASTGFVGGKSRLPQSPQKIANAIPTYGKMCIAFHLYKTNT